jgi:hypothetical protein
MPLYDMSYGDILRQYEGAMSRGKWMVSPITNTKAHRQQPDHLNVIGLPLKTIELIVFHTPRIEFLVR